jgi:undecaprenyl-diphosphatase
MTILEAIVLGLVQGFTEFFPVSSSGHLVLAEAVLGVRTPGVAFEVFVHLATAISVVFLYRQRIISLLAAAARRDREALTYLGMLAVGSIPAALAGITLSGTIAATFDSPSLAAASLLVTGGVVFSTRWLLARSERENPGWTGSLFVGIAQAFALLPGISRSGFTVAAALAARTGRERAAEFSFLLSVPAIIGASLLQSPEIASVEATTGSLQLIAAAFAAFVAGLTAIALFIRWLGTGHFHRFAYYCWAVGVAFLVYSSFAG